MAVGYWFEIWRRPGHPSFSRLIDGPPIEQASFHIGVGLVGDGTMTLPDNYDRIDEILRVAGVNSASSLVRIREDATGQVVGEWLPNQIIPSTSKDDATVEASGNGINELVEYAMTDAFDWDGSVDWESKFPDWIWGGRNLLRNGDFEDQGATPIVYTLLIDATGGNFALGDGTDTIDTIAYDISNNNLESAIEQGITAITDVNVTPLAGAPTAYSLTMRATGGTFTLTSGTTSGNLAWNISAGALETAIEGLSGITDVTVTATTIDGHPGYDIKLVNPATASLSIDTTNLTGGSASLQVSRASDGFTIEFVQPPTGVTLTASFAALTGTGSLTLSQEGELLPSGWMKSQQVSRGVPREFGVYDVFEVSTEQAHTGSWSLKIDPGAINTRMDAFAGAQQLVNVEEGGLYQASIWVYPTCAGQTYRLVIRNLWDPGDGVPIARVDVSPPANVWTKVTITDILIPDGTTEVIFRFANTNLSGDPCAFYIDDAVFAEGMAATTVGKIIRLLYESYTDPALRSPIVWDDGSGSDTPYLTLDFTDAVDSAGVAWANPEVAIRIWMRMSGLQAIEALEGQEAIEWRVVPNNVEAGTWMLQVYNEGGMNAVPAASDPTVAILGGADDTRRLVRAFRPRTNFMVEGAERVTSRAAATTLTTPFGRLESGELSREATGLESTRPRAVLNASTAEINGLVWSYELTNPQDTPLVDFRLGDTIAVHDPPAADGEGRVWEMNVVFSKEATTWDVDLLVEETV